MPTLIPCKPAFGVLSFAGILCFQNGYANIINYTNALEDDSCKPVKHAVRHYQNQEKQEPVKPRPIASKQKSASGAFCQTMNLLNTRPKFILPDPEEWSGRRQPSFYQQSMPTSIAENRTTQIPGVTAMSESRLAEPGGLLLVAPALLLLSGKARSQLLRLAQDKRNQRNKQQKKKGSRGRDRA